MNEIVIAFILGGTFGFAFAAIMAASSLNQTNKVISNLEDKLTEEKAENLIHKRAINQINEEIEKTIDEEIF